MVNIRIVEMNNKSRKGTYLYVKSAKKRGTYFKYKGGLVDPYKQYYIDRYIKKKPKGSIKKYVGTYGSKVRGDRLKKRTAIVRQAEQYVKRIRKRPTISKSITKGITNTTISDAFSISQKGVDMVKRNLLNDLVLDKGILDMLIKDENFKKLKFRLEYRINFLDRQNDVLGKTETFNKTPEQVINELKKHLKRDQMIEMEGYVGGHDSLESLDYNRIDKIKDGKLGRVEVKIIFRKG